HSLGVECNGLYWHSDAIQVDNHYHEKKRLACAEHGIALFHIFEDEWRDKKDIIQSMLLHKLGQSRSIGARKCHIVVVDQQVRKHFFNSNHIDGDVKAQFSFGLVDNDGLVCVASFRKAFLNKDNSSLELARFASKLGVHIVGGLS